MVYTFDGFAVDTATRQLLGDGEELHLTPKAFELLQILIEHRARAVSKTELQEQLWPSTFVVETNLAGLIAEIRRALRDHADKPRFVRTVYGFGYRFIGAARRGRAAEELPSLWLAFDSRQIPLAEGENVIGRAPDAAVAIDAPTISRHHARIVVEHGKATLEDMGSKNGTQLNGNRITASAHLDDGDEIRVGAVVLAFRTRCQANPTETMP